MTKKSLLRYIFRHGPTAKERNEIAALKDNPAAREKMSTHNNEPQDCQPSAAAKETADSAFDFDFRSDSRQSSVLEGIAEEETAETTTTPQAPAPNQSPRSALTLHPSVRRSFWLQLWTRRKTRSMRTWSHSTQPCRYWMHLKVSARRFLC
jgi:hypothetical protein